MTLTHEHMMTRFYNRDRESDGQFITGVLTTGIYCLPSCPARKPLPQNVRFFETQSEARSAGLRPCRRCKPDHFYERYDPGLHLVETLSADVRRDPARFADAASLVAASGAGATRLNALFREHLHLTPAAFLARERVDAARAALADGASVSDAAFGAGFESLSTFHANFRRETGLTPGEFRALGATNAFTLALPPGYRADAMLRAHGRDPASLLERVHGRELVKGIMLAGAPARLHLTFGDDAVACRVEGTAPDPPRMRVAHAITARLLNLAGDPSAFERRMEADPATARLIEGRRGLRIPRTADAWECLLWTIVGQQVNLTFAYALRSVVADLCGVPVGDGLRAHPTPEAVAGLEYGDLTARRFSRRKAEYVIDTARRIAAGELRLDVADKEPATTLERRLLEVRGLGPWSVRYLMMRGFGFADCVPIGDSGVSAALTRYLELDHRPAAAEQEALMRPFAPYRSLATYHLWASLGDPQ